MTTNEDSTIVLLDGKEMGTASRSVPLTLPGVPYGTHRVDGRRTGYQTSMVSVNVRFATQVAGLNLVSLSISTVPPTITRFEVRPLRIPKGQSGQFARLLSGEAFLDGVLMRTRERREDQVARVGMARMNGQLRAELGALDQVIDAREIQPGIEACEYMYRAELRCSSSNHRPIGPEADNRAQKRMDHRSAASPSDP